MAGWTYKTLRFGKDGKADWLTARMTFPVMAMAAAAAQAYMLAHAERGEMVVVSLEPTPELKPVMDRMIEHGKMLDHLKAEFSDKYRGGLMDQWELIHAIDPDWPNPWRDPDDPENLCTCPLHDIDGDCPIHGEC